MALESDITINTAKFEPSAVSEQTAKLNEHVIDLNKTAPKWYEVSLELYIFLSQLDL